MTRNSQQIRSTQDIIAMGQKLIATKQQLGHGNFSDWLRTEFGWNERTARRYMRAAERVESVCGIFADIDDDALANIQPTALHRLCAKSTPLHTLATAMDMAGQGVYVTRQMANGLVYGQPSGAITQFATELELEKAVSRRLKKEGVPHRRQVPCAVGRADIVSDDAIYEIKHPIDRDGFFKAIGQVLMYRACINPRARAVVVFVQPTTKDFGAYIETANASGVEVMQW